MLINRLFCSYGLIPCLVLAFANSAAAGAWTRAADDGFTSQTIRYFATDKGGRNPTFAQAGLNVYTEYGLTDAITIGIDSDQTARTDAAARGLQGGRSGAFIRARIWSGKAGDVISAQLGGSIPLSAAPSSAAPGGDDANEVKGLLQYGRGIQTDYGNGWAEVSGGFAHFTGGRGDEIKLDLTAGLRPDENWIGLVQVFGTFGLRNAAFGATDFDAVKLKLSIGRKIFGDRTLLFGISRDVITRGADPGFEISVSLWSSFSLEDVFGGDQPAEVNSPDKARSIKSAVSDTP